jgi:UDP:flavonoid glycosyltransferase YjiC (YdhE family)
MDVPLMQRLIDALASTEHRVIVSMGPLKDQMVLGERMYGEQFLPQPSILPQCDLLITHGGNNTTCEGFHFGIPMIVLPLFWDQYDNAQRVQETGFGVRLATYDWAEADFIGAVDRLVGDDRLAAAMRENAQRIQSDTGRVNAADLLERLAVARTPVTG